MSAESSQHQHRQDRILGDPETARNIAAGVKAGSESGIHQRAKQFICDAINRAQALISFDDPGRERLNLLLGADAFELPPSRQNVLVTRAALEVSWPHVHEGWSTSRYILAHQSYPAFIFDIGVFYESKLIGGIEIRASHRVSAAKVASVKTAGLWMVEIPTNLWRQSSVSPESGRRIYPCSSIVRP